METMNISLAKVTTCANQIRQENNQLNTNLREITSTMQQLSNFWNSPASDTIRQRFMAMLPAFENYRTIVDTYAKFLDQTVLTYQTVSPVIGTIKPNPTVSSKNGTGCTHICFFYGASLCKTTYR